MLLVFDIDASVLRERFFETLSLFKDTRKMENRSKRVHISRILCEIISLSRIQNTKNTIYILYVDYLW